jgi:hypothetical protein
MLQRWWEIQVEKVMGLSFRNVAYTDSDMASIEGQIDFMNAICFLVRKS